MFCNGFQAYLTVNCLVMVAGKKQSNGTIDFFIIYIIFSVL